MKQKKPRNRTRKETEAEQVKPTEETENMGFASLGRAYLEPVSDPLVFELLTETTRRCRKSLLVASLICFTVTWGDLFPKEISAFGFKVTSLQRTNLLYVLALVAAYFTSAFVIYTFTDSRLRKVRRRLDRLRLADLSADDRAKIERLKAIARTVTSESRLDSPEYVALASIADDAALVKDVDKAVTIRTIVDIYLPIIAGVGAIAAVVQEAGRLPGVQVILVFSGILVLLAAASVRLSEEYRTRRKLEPMRNMTKEFQQWVKLKKKYLTLPPNSLRARFIKGRLERTSLGFGSIPKRPDDGNGKKRGAP